MSVVNGHGLPLYPSKKIYFDEKNKIPVNAKKGDETFAKKSNFE